MKVHSTGVQGSKIGNLGKNSSNIDSNKAGISAGEGNRAAKLSLSDRASDAKQIRSIVDATPDIDEAKVAKFQSLIDSGKYKVDSEKLAERMLGEHLMTSTLGQDDE